MNIMVMIPTYNESGNIERLIKDIVQLGENYSVVVVDDNSPDGTAAIVEKISQINSHVHLLLRKKEKGRGTAGIKGFQFAIQKKVDYIVEMDADYSHHPKYIPELVESMKECDVAVGSRCVGDAADVGRSWIRRAITAFSHFYISLFLGLSVKDSTSGYRCFKREVLESISLETMISTGPSIVEEVFFACARKNYRMKEIPIIFEDRVEGESTKNLQQYLDTAWKVLLFRLKG